MKAVLPLIGLLLLGSSSVLAQEQRPPDVVVRQGVNPAQGAVIGQRIALYIDVLFPGTMPRPPWVTVPDVPGIQTFRFESQGTTMRDRIDGRDYVGQRFEFAVYARRGGPFTIPGARVTLLDQVGDPVGTAMGSPTGLTIEAPAGVDPSAPVIASTSVTVTETWSRPDGASLATGDAITRTIHREAEDVPALAMQPVPRTAPEGVGVYADPPLSEDRIARGSLTGRRTDTLTYVFEKAGQYTLPAITQPWWNLRDGSLKQATAPGLNASVSGDPAPAGPVRSLDLRRPSVRQVGALAVGITLACLAVGLAWRILPALRRAWQRRRQRVAGSEAAAFRALLEAARSGEAAGTYRAYLAWRSRLPEPDRHATQSVMRELEAILYAPHASSVAWARSDGRTLASNLRQVRSGLRHHADSHRASSPLPPLNPVPNP